MKLLRIHIENFGKLNNYTWELSDGLNTLCRENGFGKSTLAAFIKAMLYGLPASTKRNLDLNERKKYLPWQGGAYGGSLEFECAAGSFRIERFFGAKEANDEFRLFDLATNKPSDAFSSEVGIELFGIDAEGFARSAFLSQSGIDNHDENVTVTAKLTGLLENVNDMGSYDVAMDIIDKRRKFYELKGGKGRVSDLSSALSNGRRELDRLNELLIEQKNKEDELQQIKAQIASAEHTLNDLREQLRLAELSRARRADCEQMRERIGQAEEQRRKILSAFQNGQIPTERELLDAQRRLKEFRILQGQHNALKLSDPESEALERLESRYQHGFPSKELLSEIKEATQNASDLHATLRAFRETEATPYQRRFEATGTPSDTLIAQVNQKLDRAEQEKKKLQEINSTPVKGKSKLSKIAAWTFLALGALLIAVSFFSPILKIMLLIFGGMTAVAGAVLLLTGGNKKAEIQRAEINEKAEKVIQTLYADAERFLAQYGFSASRENLRQALRQLAEEAHHAVADAQKQQADALHRRELAEKLSEQRRRLQVLFAQCGIFNLPDDPNSELIRIHTDLREWETLSEKSRGIEEQKEQLQGELSYLQNQIAVFLNRLTKKNNPQPEACLEQMEALCRSYAITQESIRNQQQELLEREEQQRNAQPTKAFANADLKALEAEWLQRLEDLRAAERDLHRQWTHSADQTQRIPQLEDELAHLSTELGTAEHNLNLLRLTAQFLTESKEALSTRYLGGMQEHFARYRAMAEGENASDAVIDTSFSISVREAGKSRELESFSRGSRDILQFCARLALTNAMFEEGEKPFLLLDDPFVNLDETHFTSVRLMLDKLAEEFQILYFVCHSDRC